jgi:hypothetical protein
LAPLVLDQPTGTPAYAIEARTIRGEIGGEVLVAEAFGLYAGAATKLESQELAFEREKLAFQTIPPNILARQVGNFVAVRAGQILDADPDLPTLMTRFFRMHGEGAVYITKIGDDQDDLRIDTPFFDEG